MPKIEDKCSKDWSNANKFTMLLKDEDTEDVDEPKDESED